jgi:hypothetical protein
VFLLKAIPTTSNVKNNTWSAYGSDFVNYGMGNVDLITCAVDADGCVLCINTSTLKKRSHDDHGQKGWRI